jgi:hypothetical protein
MPRGHPWPDPDGAPVGNSMERRAFLGSLVKREVLAAKNFRKTGLDFFGNPSIAS